MAKAHFSFQVSLQDTELNQSFALDLFEEDKHQPNLISPKPSAVTALTSAEPNQIERQRMTTLMMDTISSVESHATSHFIGDKVPARFVQ